MIFRTIFATLTLFSTLALGASWQIDDAHSVAEFKVKHMMVSNVKGHITGIKGTIEIDEKNPGKSKVKVTLDPATINTSNQKRDDHLKSPDFLDIKKFAAITFESKSVSKKGEKLLVTGPLTIKGISKNVTLDVEGPTKSIKDPWGNIRRGASATAKINRKDFGITWNKVMDAGGVVVGDDIFITIEMEMMQSGKASH
jgi:polyisoprenoid-binding protein YceI